MFITCIDDDDDDNDDLNVINLMHLNLSNFVFVKFHQVFFEIKVLVSTSVSSYWKQRFWTTKCQNIVSKLRPETPSGSQCLDYIDTFVSLYWQ